MSSDVQSTSSSSTSSSLQEAQQSIDDAKEAWNQDMEALGQMSAGDALNFIVMNLIPQEMNYLEATQGYLAEVMDALSQMGNDMTTMESDFDDDNNVTSNDTTIMVQGDDGTFSEDTGKHAIWSTSSQATGPNAQNSIDAYNDYQKNQVTQTYDCANDIVNLLEQDTSVFGDINDPNSFAGAIMSQLEVFLGVDAVPGSDGTYEFVPSQQNLTTTQNSWNAAWASANGAVLNSNGTGPNSDPGMTTQYIQGDMVNSNPLQQIQTTLQNMENEVTGMSSQTQNEAQYYGTQDNSMGGVDSKVGQNIGQTEQSINQHMSSG